MTQEEIQEYNKRCAEFLGGLYVRDESLSFEPKGRWHINKFPDALQDYNLKFHSDWNWIMELLEKIESLRYNTIIGHNLTVIQSPPVKKISSIIAKVEHKNLSKKEAVVQAINQFLIWYNENNK